MTYRFDQIKRLQLEISSNCNVACPQCPRNYYGGDTISELPLVNWSLSQLQHVMSAKFVKQLDFVYFCGTYGDPMFNKNIVQMCKWIKSINKGINIGIHTNGSLGKTDDYKQLACIVNFIAFGLDGLEDTNHIYRRNADWDKILKNTASFISAGGNAHWDFIVFEHNQHQVEKAKDLSKTLGFKTFNVKKTSRFFDKKHRLVSEVVVHDKKKSPIYVIKPTTRYEFFNTQYKALESINHQTYASTAKINCHYLGKKEIYIGADGYVFPCGWLHDRLYGIESSMSKDRLTLYDMMENIGGKKHANCFYTSLEKIVNGAWFDSIQQSWHKNQLERCAWLCGDKVNFIQEQNQMIHYDV